MGTNNSIFDFGDRFGIESPFGDWGKEILGSDANDILSPPAKNNFHYENTAGRKLELTPPKSMLTLSNVVAPASSTPGSARITISMLYSLVTKGEGAVPVFENISEPTFRNFFASGNRLLREVLKLKQLPSLGSEGVVLSAEELVQSKRKDDTGNPLFWKYYLVEVIYEFELIIKPDFSLWNGIKAMYGSLETYGVIMNFPFYSLAQRFHYLKNLMSIEEVRRLIDNKYRSEFTKEELFSVREAMRRDAHFAWQGIWASLIIWNLINDDREKYKNSLIQIENKFEWIVKNANVIGNQDIRKILTEINSEIDWNDLTSNTSTKKVVILEFLTEYDNFVSYLYDHCLSHIDEFEGKTVAGAGMNEKVSNSQMNSVVLNPYFFKQYTIGSKFEFSDGMTPMEVIVHEAGHNAAAEFAHSKSKYLYSEDGLQSNRKGKIFPSYDNTIGIINDPTNRSKMRIL